MWRFLKSEMMVIMGLVEDAARTDAEIAEVYGLNKGTVASVRRRLEDAGAIAYANVPAFNKLGCEMMGFHMGTTDPAVPAHAKASAYTSYVDTCPQAFNVIVGGNNILFQTALRNMTELERIVEAHNKYFSGSRRASRAKIKDIFFPYPISKGTFTLNYAPLVYRYFKVDSPPPKSRHPVSNEVVTPDFSQNEKNALVAMVEAPRMSDREIAASMNLSRQAVTRIRNKLLDEGVITPVCIPNLYKWGFELLAVAHSRFTMDLSWEKRMRTEPKEVLDLAVFGLTKPSEAVALYMVSKFQEYAENLDQVMSWYHKMQVFDDKPDIHLYVLERSMEIRTFDFGPAVRNLLLSK